MKYLRWFPFRYIIRKAATSQGFLDPIELLARLRGLSQPSEIAEPIELLRAGVVFHARGLINSKVIQHNLDWVWPWWIEKQYDPTDTSFIPRAFSVTHVNLTHRNWTAIGYPDFDHLPVVDPRGLLTPFMDSWSLDAYLIDNDGNWLIPSRSSEHQQRYTRDKELEVVTQVRAGNLELQTRASVAREDGIMVCKQQIKAGTDSAVPCRLVISLRPVNPEGVSFINSIAWSHERRYWTINDEHKVYIDRTPALHHVSDYLQGDVLNNLGTSTLGDRVDCEVGLATAAAVFELNKSATLTIRIPLEEKQSGTGTEPIEWRRATGEVCTLQCPEPKYVELFDAAVTSLILHSPKDVYPGPYTYKRFWFRDAAFIIHALLNMNMIDRAKRALDQFPHRQTPMGYFRSQEGEWDANGEVLWILRRYEQLTNSRLPEHWHGPVLKGARWIVNKRLSDTLKAPHAGLMPAGFSAEHLGPNDYYYWDDFWSIAGLQAAGVILKDTHKREYGVILDEIEKFSNAVDRSLQSCEERLGRPGMPASPYRRLDAGAIGSIAAGYPLQLYAPDDIRLQDCVEFLLDDCFIRDAFFQDMIHSGLNAYLTLQVAQVLLRNGDERYLQLMDSVAELASATGQWPEAIHPQTKGGCMGDGHHVWASAEWALLLRNCFVREEGRRLILCAGIPARWLQADKRHKEHGKLRLGPTPTDFGPITVTIEPGDRTRVCWTADWFGEPPEIQIQLPGHELTIMDRHCAWLERKQEVSVA